MPPAYAAEMVPFDPLVGEFRVHYAGFFDPGFGHSAAGGTGSRAVLEVRSREVPFLLGHGQTIGRLIYERLAERPTGSTARRSAPTTRRRRSSSPSISSPIHKRKAGLDCSRPAQCLLLDR